jgi:hypothetical protein
MILTKDLQFFPSDDEIRRDEDEDIEANSEADDNQAGPSGGRYQTIAEVEIVSNNDEADLVPVIPRRSKGKESIRKLIDMQVVADSPGPKRKASSELAR